MTSELIARLRVRPQTEPFYRDGIYLDGRVPTVEALAADALEAQAKRIEELERENDTLRGLLGNSAKPCPYCGLAAEDQGKCERGFPGCARADDQMLSQHFADGYRALKAEAALKECMAHADAMEKELVSIRDLDGYYFSYVTEVVNNYREWRAKHG